MNIIPALKAPSRMRPRNLVLCLMAVLLGLAFPLADANAVRVSMKRVTFEGKQRSEIVTIINNTGSEQTYRLGWKRLRMSEDKSLRSIEENDKAEDILWAEDMVRYAPRRITVPAGGSQQVRLLLRRPADIKEAEYRAHLWIVSEGKPPEFEANPSNDKQEIRLAVQPAISLPVFVRNGNLDAQVSISDVKLKRAQSGLNVSLSLNRQGNRSIYGDFDFVCKDGGSDVILKQVRGVAVYTEINRRLLSYDLPLDDTTTSSCNTVQVVFRADPDDAKFKGAVLAETTASL